MQRHALVGCSLLALALPAAGDGPVTVRFRNPHPFPVYLEATNTEGIQWPFGLVSDRPPCTRDSDCMCLSLPPPIPRVRILEPGVTIEDSWKGGHVELRQCGTYPGCFCSQSKTAARGRYEAKVSGSRSIRQAAPSAAASLPKGGIADWFSPDLTTGLCHATAAFELGATPATVEVPIVCDPPPKPTPKTR